jgi:DNA polymerase-3 subunit alpha
VGLSAIEAIIEAREAKGPFTSLADFCRKTDLRRVNRRVVEALIKCGAFDSTGSARARMFEAIDTVMDEGGRHQQQQAIGQSGLFDAMEGTVEPKLPDVPEWKESQLLAFEKESIGFYLTGHPLAAYQEDIKRYGTATTETLDAAPDGKEVTMVGIIAAIKPKMTKKGEKMAIVNIEDLTGAVEMIVFPDLYKTSHDLLLTDTPLIVAGTLDKSEQGNKIKATRLHLLRDVKKKGATRLDIRLNATGMTQDDLVKVRDILARHKGTIPVYLRLQNPTKKESLISVGRDIRVNPNEQLIGEIESLLGAGAVSLG